jgi:hypothetical protein
MPSANRTHLAVTICRVEWNVARCQLRPPIASHCGVSGSDIYHLGRFLDKVLAICNLNIP